jgi:hypothetical protein
MILPGTKIEIIASNKRGKGPNIGSIGYVANIYGITALPVSAVRHLKAYTEVTPHKKPILNYKWRKFQLISAGVVFTRFGRKGRTRIRLKNVRIIVPNVALTKTRTFKTFLKGVNRLNFNNEWYTAIASLPDNVEHLHKLPLEEFVARLYCHTLYLLKNTTFCRTCGVFGNYVPAPTAHNKTIMDFIDLHKFLLSTTSFTLLKQVALDKYNNELYQQALYEEELIPAMQALKIITAHFIKLEIDTITTKMLRVLPASREVYTLQFLDDSILKEILYERVLHSDTSVADELMANINKMKKLYWSLSTSQPRETHTLIKFQKGEIDGSTFSH